MQLNKITSSINVTIPNSKIRIKISDILVNRLSSINNKVSNFILDMMRIGLIEKNLKSIEHYPNYLDYDYDSSSDNITFITESSIVRNNITNPWLDNSRQGSTIIRVIRKILSEDYINKNINNNDIEQFINDWRASNDKETKVEVLRGWEILTAFNFRNDISEKFGVSCANFNKKNNGYDEPLIKWFYFYIYNKNISVVTVWNKGKIRARSVTFEGKQLKDSGAYNKGEYYKYMNNVYSEGDGKWKSIIKQWAMKNGCILDNFNYTNNNNMEGHIYLSIKTRYKTYPPVDSMYVNIDENILTNSYKEYNNEPSSSWYEAYKLELKNLI